MSMHKSTNSWNCEFCVFKSCSFWIKLFFSCFNFWSISPKKWSYCSKAKLISLYRVYLFNFTLILRHIEWKLWTSIKVSCRLGKHLSICFLIVLFFLQFAEFNLKAPPYSKTLHYSRISMFSRSAAHPVTGGNSTPRVGPTRCFKWFFRLLPRPFRICWSLKYWMRESGVSGIQ